MFCSPGDKKDRVAKTILQHLRGTSEALNITWDLSTHLGKERVTNAAVLSC